MRLYHYQNAQGSGWAWSRSPLDDPWRLATRGEWLRHAITTQRFSWIDVAVIWVGFTIGRAIYEAIV